MRLRIHLQNNQFFITSLLFIFGIGFLIRIWNLSNHPVGFFCDEASIGYNAYTIITTGKDEYGNILPFFFEAFGEYKSPIQIYSTTLFVGLLGLNEFATRVPSAIYGALSIIAVYLLTIEIMKGKSHAYFSAIFAALFIAVSPWHIHFSRISMEALTAYTLFTTLGVYFFLKFRDNPKYFVLSIVFFILAFYSYFPGRIFIPIFGIMLTILYGSLLLRNLRYILIGLIIVFISMVPMVMHLLSPDGLSRWNQVSIFSNPPEDSSVADHILNNYFSHFSIDFLALKGDIEMPGQFITRHSVRNFGELYIYQIPFIVIGIIYLLLKLPKVGVALLIWLILYPLGSMFTLEKSAQATRSIIGVIPFQLLTGIGIGSLMVYGIERLKRTTYILSSFLIIVTFISAGIHLKAYFTEYPKYSADFWGWQSGPREIIKYFNDNNNQYDEYYMEGAFNAPHIFFNFYAPHTCSKCKIGVPHLDHKPYAKQLFAVTPQYTHIHSYLRFRIKNTVYYPDGKIAFLIGEIVQ